MSALLLRWRETAGAGRDALGKMLIAAYEEPQRHYHNLGHVSWLLDEADCRSSAIADPVFVGYAIWFHDAVYVPGMPDNEGKSAAWARRSLPGYARLDELVHLIEMTKKHHEGEAGGDAALFLDMDIAILGAPWDEYRRYAAGIRAEYPHVPDPAFAAGRGAFLTAQLERDRLFHSDLYETEFAAQARANMGWEAAEMKFGRMVRA